MLKKNHITDFFISQINKYKITPENVIIEITESEEMTDMHIALDTMIRLRLCGFKLALDDFGSGYSNMEVISSLPVNQLKIDKSLVRGVDENKQKLKVLESVVELAKNMSLSIVAEGIETEIECNIVKRLGVTMGQGYYFSKPRSIKSLKKLLEIQNIIIQQIFFSGIGSLLFMEDLNCGDKMGKTILVAPGEEIEIPLAAVGSIFSVGQQDELKEILNNCNQ